MASIIRIKRRSTNATAPSTSEVVNGELALNEFTAGSEILYYGKGGDVSASSSVLKIGGPGAYLTADTNQTPTGIKTFSTTTLLITGGSNTNVLTTNGSGAISWAAQSSSSNTFTSFTDGTNTAAADIATDTFKFRGTAPLTVVVTNDDATHGDSALFAVSAASTSAAGVVQLSDSTSTTSSTQAATLTAVKSAYDLAAAALPKSGGTMTSFITLHADPTSAMHATTKQYVDSLAQGIDVRASCRAATAVTDIALATGGLLTVDGVQTVAGDRVLVKDQTTPSQNGIYVVAAGAWSRATDADTSAEVTAGMFTFITEGTVYADSGWVLTTNDAITLGSTGLAFAQFSGAGQITAGDGLTKSGNTLNVVTANAARIVVNADSIDLAAVTVIPTAGVAGISCLQDVAVDAYGRVTEKLTANVRTGSTSQTGILQLTDSTSSTSTTTAATPASVKSAYDLAGNALPKSGGTMTGKVTTGAGGATYASLLVGVSAADPTSPVSGDLWNNAGDIKFYTGSATKTVAFVGGISTQVQFNNSGVLGANAGFTYDSTNEILRVRSHATRYFTIGSNAAGASEILGYGNRALAINSVENSIDIGDKEGVVNGTYIQINDPDAAVIIKSPNGTVTIDSPTISFNSVLSATDATAIQSQVLSGTGVTPTIQIICPSAAVTLTSGTSTQAVFGSSANTITLQASTTYMFEGQYLLGTGTVSHTTAMSFVLTTATMTNCTWTTFTTSPTALNTSVTALATAIFNSVTGGVCNSGGSANANTIIKFTGIMRVNVAGTCVPNIAFSAAPGGTCQTLVGSYLRFYPIGANTINSVGTAIG